MNIDITESLTEKKQFSDTDLFDIMALRVGAYLGEGEYYSVGACSKKSRILLSSNEEKDKVNCFVSLN